MMSISTLWSTEWSGRPDDTGSQQWDHVFGHQTTKRLNKDAKFPSSKSD